MNNKRWIVIFFLILLAIPLAIILFFSLPWMLMGTFIWLSPNPPKPEITYAEFPFELVYENDEEIVTVNDIYICEYDGIEANEGTGKYRVWKGYIKGTGDETLFIKEIDGKKIYCSVGSPKIYMDDYHDIATNEPVVYSVEENLYGTGTHFFDEPDMEEHGIKIISYKFADPIENTFG